MKLSHCVYCNSTGVKVKYSKNWGYFAACPICHATGPSCKTETEAIESFNQRHYYRGTLDIEYDDGQTTHYLPEVMASAYDEDDNEIETIEATSDGCNYFCEVCGNMMLGGDEGWFDESEGEYGIAYHPRFNFCPNCGRSVIW